LVLDFFIVMSDPANLYREEILENFRNPQNYGTLNAFDAKSKQQNPLCGDEIELFIQFNNDEVYDISFLGKGCAISISSTSILTEYVKDKKKKHIKQLTDDELIDILGIEISDARKKCALLGLYVLRDCLA